MVSDSSNNSESGKEESKGSSLNSQKEINLNMAKHNL